MSDCGGPLMKSARGSIFNLHGEDGYAFGSSTLGQAEGGAAASGDALLAAPVTPFPRRRSLRSVGRCSLPHGRGRLRSALAGGTKGPSQGPFLNTPHARLNPGDVPATGARVTLRPSRKKSAPWPPLLHPRRPTRRWWRVRGLSRLGSRWRYSRGNSGR